MESNSHNLNIHKLKKKRKKIKKGKRNGNRTRNYKNELTGNECFCIKCSLIKKNNEFESGRGITGLDSFQNFREEVGNNNSPNKGDRKRLIWLWRALSEKLSAVWRFKIKPRFLIKNDGGCCEYWISRWGKLYSRNFPRSHQLFMFNRLKINFSCLLFAMLFIHSEITIIKKIALDFSHFTTFN